MNYGKYFPEWVGHHLELEKWELHCMIDDNGVCNERSY